MGGGLMQLVAHGAQDIYLTGNPQITFFKIVYRRHTNFSMETIEQTIDGTSTTSANNEVGSVTISRNGDLIHKIYLTSSSSAITDGSKLIKEVELRIGGTLIDKHTREWMNVWNELTIPASKQAAFKWMTAGHAHTTTTMTDATNKGTDNKLNMIQIPLLFWFCRNPGLALPIIALQYHDIVVKITAGTNEDLGNSPVTYEVWVDYIFLDTDERRRFAQVAHEYLIEQVQIKEESNTSELSVDLNFNHPVKELIWTTPNANVESQTTKLELNGNDRFRAMKPEYFQLRQPYEYHTSVPGPNYSNTLNSPELSPPLECIVDGTHGGSKGTISSVSIEDTPGNAQQIVIDNGQTITQLKFHANANNIPNVGDSIVINISDQADDSQFHVLQKETTVNFRTNNTITIHKVYNHISSDPIAPNDLIDVTIKKRSFQSHASSITKKINCYSFSLKPEEHQPSGSCNFSRIDSAKLKFNTPNDEAINIYAVNYNVLRIMSGMAGIAYSN